MSRFIRTWVVALVGALVIGGAMSSGAQAQGNGVGDCEDPFEGVNTRFSASVWDQTNFCKTNIDLSEVRSGGVRPDGIPSIDNPSYEPVEVASEWLAEQSPVVSVTVNDETRAYPLAILTLHEIVNTEQGGVPITVTFCPLCNSAIVFNREVDDTVLDFGVSGNLRNSDLIMYDRQTESWWQQFTGEAIVGEYTGTELEIFPSQIIGFGFFAEEFPEAEVLSRDTGIYGESSYGRNPYAGYDSSQPFLYDGDLDDRLPATSRVLAGVISGEPIAYPFGALQEEIVVNDTVGDEQIVAIWQPGTASALDASAIDASRDVGTAAVYERTLEDGTVLTFNVEDGRITDAETGSTWNAFGRAVGGELEGTQLRQFVAAPHFWFAWAAFQPETEVYGL